MRKQSTEAFAALKRAFRGANRLMRIDESVAEALVVSLMMVVHQELVDGSAKRILAKEDHAIQTALSYGPDPSLGVSVQIRRPRRKPHGFDARTLEQVAVCCCEDAVAIED